MTKVVENVFAVPQKGPVILVGSLKAKILARHYSDLVTMPAESSQRCLLQNCIDFIMRKNCSCPADSPYCMCGGGFSSGDIMSHL